MSKWAAGKEARAPGRNAPAPQYRGRGSHPLFAFAFARGDPCGSGCL